MMMMMIMMMMMMMHDHHHHYHHDHHHHHDHDHHQCFLWLDSLQHRPRTGIHAEVESAPHFRNGCQTHVLPKRRSGSDLPKLRNDDAEIK